MHGGAQKTAMNSSFGGHSRQSSEPCSQLTSEPKAHSAWNTVKSSFKARSSTPNLRRWLSAPRTSDTSNLEEERRRADEQESVFCNSLLALMKHTGRFDYIDFSRDCERRQSSAGKEAVGKESRESEEPRAKRFSWTR